MLNDVHPAFNASEEVMENQLEWSLIWKQIIKYNTPDGYIDVDNEERLAWIRIKNKVEKYNEVLK